MTPYQLHVATWKNGCGAPICAAACKVVTFRGTLPCDILFIGEAPGASEDVLGSPFVGPAGALLDRIAKDGFALYQQPGTVGPKYNAIRWGFTNLVGCIPRDEDGGKATEPDVESIEACAPRLTEIIGIANPKAIVCVGGMARDWLKRGTKTFTKVPDHIRMIDIIHPAAILRANIAGQGLLVQRCVIALRDLAEDLMTPGQGTETE